MNILRIRYPFHTAKVDKKHRKGIPEQKKHHRFAKKYLFPIFISRKIISYEEACFEKKYHLKENTLQEEQQKVLKQVPIRYQKQELVEDLKKLKTVLLNQKTSPGYSSVISILLIIIVIGILLITLILCSIGIRG